MLSEFVGMPSLDRCIKHLLKEILSIKRNYSSNSINNFGLAGNTNGINPSSSIGFTERKW